MFWLGPYIHLAVDAGVAKGLLFRPFIHVTNIEHQLYAGTMPVLGTQQ